MKRRPYQLPELARVPNVIHGFSEIAYRNMSFRWEPENIEQVVRNRALFLGDLGVSIDDCCLFAVDEIPQVRIITSADRGANMRRPSVDPQGDAAITQEKNLFLMMLSADCLPVLFIHSKSEGVGIAHQSRRMTDARLVTKVVTQFQASFGIPPNEFIVGIGPGIHQASYRLEKPEQSNNPAWYPYLENNADGTTSVDLIRYTIDQLTGSGVPRNQITVSSVDTGASTQFFSHYRGSRTNEPEGRFASVIGLRSVD